MAQISRPYKEIAPGRWTGGYNGFQQFDRVRRSARAAATSRHQSNAADQ
jgi:hypothetical protein